MDLNTNNKSNDNNNKPGCIGSFDRETINCQNVLTGMSLEMRTQMNSIVAFSFLMQGSSYNHEGAEEFSNQIFNSCKQLTWLFDSYLYAQMIDTGKLKTNFKIYNLNYLLEELFSEFRDIIQKEDSKKLIFITENHLSDFAYVFIDSNTLRLIMRSLFQNAIKNTKSGYIKIGCELVNNEVKFFVIDSGQAYLKCKEFFYTEDVNESLAKFYDTSLAINLTLAKKIIRLLGGNIRIECNGHSGTGIYFSFPVKVVGSSDIPVKNQISTTFKMF